MHQRASRDIHLKKNLGELNCPQTPLAILTVYATCNCAFGAHFQGPTFDAPLFSNFEFGQCPLNIRPIITLGYCS